MIGSLKTKTANDREAIIIGAGISGLLTAYVLDKNGFKVTLIEEAERPGGLIFTRQTEYGPAEAAAHSFLVTDEVREICQDLGVELSSVNPEARARYIYRRGKLRRFPLSIIEALIAFFKAYFVLSRPDVSRGSATLEEWGNRHLGKGALNYLLSPFLTGIYAARPSEICVGAAFPSMEIPAGQSLLSAQLRKFRLRLTRPKGQNKAGHKKMMAPTHGMGSLIQALEKRLNERLGERFRKGEKVLRLPEGSNVILAVPAPRAAALLSEKDPELSKALSEVQYSPLVSATIFAPKNAFANAPRGVGVLVPEKENRGCLGILFNSSAFPGRAKDEESLVSLTMMFGGTVQPEIIDKPDHELHALIRYELKTVLNIDESGAQSAQIFIHRWPNAIPRYDRKLIGAWDAARLGWCSTPGHILVGNYTGQVSIRGMMQDAYAMGLNLAAGLHV